MIKRINLIILFNFNLFLILSIYFFNYLIILYLGINVIFKLRKKIIN